MESITLWNGRTVPRVGVGCWAIGGKMMAGDLLLNYGDVNDEVSKAGLRRADELGAKVFDTAAAYGGGHSEKLLGEVFADRDDIVIVTKFGSSFDADTRQATGEPVTPDTIRASIDRSRKNLRRDRIDLALFHVNEFPPGDAAFVFDTLAELRGEGKIDAFGWSTDFIEGVEAFGDRDGFVAIENNYNVFDQATDLMQLAQEKELLSISRLPLAMGLLTGKYALQTRVGANDIRGQPVPWLTYFKDGKAHPDYFRKLDALRDLLSVDGRSLAQGALCWILARSPIALPVPGFKTPEQITDNLGALEKGALPESVMAEIDDILHAETPA